MPEAQAVGGLGQHADGTCLVHRRHQVRHVTAQHDGQIGDREVRAEQGRRPQDVPYRTGHEAEPIRYRRGQGARRGAAGQLGGTRLGDGQAGATGQRGDQLGDVERVARRPAGQPQQVVIRLAAGQRGHEVGHRCPGQPGELEPGGVVGHPSQRQHVVPLRDRPRHADQQQRRLPRRPGQPPPQGDAGLVGPLQVVHDQDGRPHRALLGDEGEQLLGQHRWHVGAAAGRDLAAQEADDRVPPLVD